MRRTKSLVLAAVFASGLAGCVDGQSNRYPSLLPRPIESQGFAEPVVAMPQAKPDPALDKEIADSEAKLDSAAKAFSGAAQKAEALVAVARGVPEGTDAWLDAQVALGELDQQHVAVTSLVSGLQERAIARGVAGEPPYPALDALIARADSLSKAQSARIDGLNTALSGR